VALVAAVLIPACAADAAPTRTTPVMAAVTSGLTINGPVTVTMDATHPGLTIRGHSGSLAQPLAVFDYAGNPIFYVASDGGAGVTGDNFSIFAPRDVFNPVVVLHKDGAISFGGKSGPTLYGGPADPRVSSPCVTLAMIQRGPVPAALDRACMGGDRYMRSGADSTDPLAYATYVFTSAGWTVQ
jgi:hypothetical protein